MAHIVFTWELGSSLGHISRFLPIALKLREKGYAVSFILKDLSKAYELFGKHDFPVYQAPIWQYKLQNEDLPPANFAEILILYGYLDAKGLSGMVSGWCNLFEKLKPDLVLFDYSPTALLASRNYHFKRAILGTGFFHPPHITPMPNFRNVDEVLRERLLVSEKRVLKNINIVLENFHCTSLANLYDLFDVDEDFLLTFSELDHYSGRVNAKYWGGISSGNKGIDPIWIDDNRKKVFAYLKPEYCNTMQILDVLAKLDCQALIFAPSLSQENIDKIEADNIKISTQPYKITTIAKECDIGICHAGHDTISALLLAGKPLMLLPMQYEQMLVALNVERIRAGVIGYQNDTTKNLKIKLNALLNSLRLKSGAQSFSKKYRATPMGNSLDPIINRCVDLVSQC